MARIPYADLSTLPAAVRAQIQAFGELNIVRMLAHTEPATGPWHAMVGALVTDPDLDGRVRELAILRIAHLTEAPYERRHHEEIAESLGVSERAIAATARPVPDPRAFEGPQQAVLALVDALVLEHRASEEVFRAVHDRLGDAATAKLVLLIGVYLATAVFLNAFEVELEPVTRRGRLWE